jgi:hypothetical protein
MLDDNTRTLVFKEVAHARATREDQLRDILDDLCLLLWWQGQKPFREADLACKLQSDAPEGIQHVMPEAVPCRETRRM